MSAECSFMVTSKPPPERVSGDRRFGINAISANAMTNTALLEEIGPMLRGHYTALTEEPLPEYCLEIVERFAPTPRNSRRPAALMRHLRPSLPPPAATFSTPPSAGFLAFYSVVG